MIHTEDVPTCLVCNSSHSTVCETTSTMMDSKDGRKWSFRECTDCGMVYLSPRVLPTSLSHYYKDSYLPYRGPKAWGKYENLVEGDLLKIDKKRVQTVKKYLKKKKGTILDIGCGKPSFLLETHQQLGLNAIGQDFSDSGWKGNEIAYQDLDLFTGSLFDLPNSIEADVITMWHYLEHDYTPSKTLKHLSKNQPKDCKLIIEVPNYDSKTRMKYGPHWSGFHSPRHTGLYTLNTMTKLLEENGWSVIDSYSYGTLDPYTLDWMSRMEMKEIDWSESMEKHFVSYVIGKLIRPYYFFDRQQSLGFMTVVAENKG